MTTEVREPQPFGMQFGDNPEDMTSVHVLGDSRYDAELQLRVEAGGHNSLYEVSESPDGKLTYLSPVNAFQTSQKTLIHLDGTAKKDRRYD